MSWKANTRVRGQKPRLKLPCFATAAIRIIKFPQPNPAPLFSTPLQCASENPEKCFRTRARLRPKICRSNQPFLPVALGSNRPACGKRECSGRQFGDERFSQVSNGDNSRCFTKPDICAIRACFPMNLEYNFNKNNANP